MSNQTLAMQVLSVQDTLSRVQLKKTTDQRIPYLFKETFAFNSLIEDREQRKVTAEVYLELFDKMFDEGIHQFEDIANRRLLQDVCDYHKKWFGRAAFIPLLKILNGSNKRTVPYLRSSAGYIEVAFFMGVRMIKPDLGSVEGGQDQERLPVFAWHYGVSGIETDINDPLKIVHREILLHVGCMNED